MKIEYTTGLDKLVARKLKEDNVKLIWHEWKTPGDGGLYFGYALGLDLYEETIKVYQLMYSEGTNNIHYLKIGKLGFMPDR